MSSKTFCVLPWLHAGTRTDGDVSLCCVARGSSGINLNRQTLEDYWNSDYVKNVRLQMLAGEKVSACERCYAEETHGYKSHRIVENEAWEKRLGREEIRRLAGQTAPDGALDENLQYLDLRLGHTCNMQCVMCQPRESSQWLPAARKLSELTADRKLKNDLRYKVLIDRKQFEWYRNELFWENLDSFLPSIKQIVIAGGEPFLIKEHYAFLKACCEKGEAAHIRLHYHTNGTIFPDELIPYWEKFEKVHFFISIDGIGETANYVRYPSDWEKIQKNIARFDGLGENTNTLIHFTAHALNIYRLPETLDWFDRLGLRNRKLFHNLLEYVCVSLAFFPHYMNVQVLPREYKMIVTEKLNDYLNNNLYSQRGDSLTGIIDYMNSEDKTDEFPRLIEYTWALDEMRGTNLLATFPELAPCWQTRKNFR